MNTFVNERKIHMKTLCKVIKYNPITIIMMISAILVFGIRISIMSVLATITMLTIARIMDLDIRDMYKKYPNTKSE